jgi:6-phosphogluconolactonase
MSEIKVFGTTDELVQETARRIADLATETINAQGVFSIALSGGSTPGPVYEALASSPLAQQIEWPKVHIFWGDERCVEPADARSNYHMAKLALLDRVAIPLENIHRMKGEDEPHNAAEDYEVELRDFIGLEQTFLGAGLDLVLLGLGDNGHTASIFPGLPALLEPERWILAQYVEVVGMWRLTMTPPAINAASNVWFVVSGAGKARVLQRVIEGPFEPEVLPAQTIKATSGNLVWLLDQPAASALTAKG